MPPLVTTSSAGTPQVDAAVIGLPNTSLLFGNDQVGREARIGGRLNVGLWLDPNWNTGLGYRATSVSGDQTTYDVVTDGSLIVGRPFYNVQNNARDALLIGFPGESSGDLHVRAANSFQMHDLFGRFRISDDDVNRVDFIAGYEYARIGDELSITDSRTFLNPFNPRVGVRLDGVDQFRVTNKFDGATLGLMGDIVRGRAKFSWLGKMGYGNMNEVVKISGSTVPSSGGTVGVPSIGGLYTQASNIGTYVENRRVFVPEFNFNLHLQMTQRLDFSIGYTFLYFSNVALAGDQVDRRVNQSQQLGGLVGQPFPIHTSNHSTDFWLQGLNLGLNGSF